MNQPKPQQQTARDRQLDRKLAYLETLHRIARHPSRYRNVVPFPMPVRRAAP